jgi:hypothetical protein
MTTVIIEDSSSQAKKLVEYVRTLPFVKVKTEETDKPIKWTPKMIRALKETEFRKGDINNFWDE